MVQLVHKLSNFIKRHLEKNVKDFVEYAEKAGEYIIAKKTLRDTFRGLILENAWAANRIACEVQMISNAYIKQTCDHQVITRDHMKYHEHKELRRGTEATSSVEQSVMQTKGNDLEKELDDKIRCIEREIKSVLPPIPHD